MAVIMKIRNRLGFVIIGLIGFAIVGFLLQDSLSSNSSLLRFNANNVGSVNGKAIDIQDYEKKVQQALENARTQGQGNTDDATVWSVRDQVWSQYVNDILMEEKYEKLGVLVTNEEMKDQLQGANPHPAVRQSFSNPETGQFDPAQISLFVQRLEEDDDATKWNQWENFKKFLLEDRMKSKYNALVKKAMYAPSWQANENYLLTASTVDFEYVYLPYADVSDGDVKVEDSELKNYLNAHKTKYKREESRSVEYVSFDILPSAADTARTKAKLEESLENFKTTKDDSSFLSLYSDKGFDGKYYSKEELTISMKDTLFVVDTGTVLGPYYEEGSFKFAKLVDKKMIADSVKARHIFFSIAGAKSQEDVGFKRTQADSVLKLIQSGGDFVSLAIQYSDDEATKFSGGDWGWIKPNTKFQTINNGLFYQKAQGDIFMAPADEPGNAGFHVIEITEAKPTKQAVQVAFLTKQVAASIETERALYADASKFASTNNKADAFKAAAANYTLRPAEGIRKSSYSIPGLGSARDLVKWVFEASVNEVSEVFSLDNKYIVVLLTKVQEEGIATLEAVRTEIEVEVKKEKKAEVLKAKITGTDLNAIAGATSKTTATVSGLSLGNTFIEAVGNESSVVGKALGMNSGETSAGIAGENGVFAIKVTAKNTPPALTDAGSQKKQLAQTAESRVDFMLAESIKKSAEVKDERFKFY